MTEPLVSIRDLSKDFVVRERGRKTLVRALNGITLDVYPGETLAVVGESGSGKSTLGRAVLQLETPSAGSVTFAGRNLTAASARERVAARRDMQVIFQDPYSSLSPGRTALQQVMEPLRVLSPGVDARSAATTALAQVGLVGDAVHRLPRAFSGGQRQRIAIARAIAVRPQFIVCDEPVSALDVSIQAQVTELLRELQQELGLTYLFISHDLSVVRDIATRTAVMYRGRIVEVGPTAAIFQTPQHAYTRRLLDAVLTTSPEQARAALRRLTGEPVAAVAEPAPDAALRTIAPGHLVLS